MSGSLKRARLVPYDTGGKNLQTDKAIKFDFNPETLTLKVSTGEQQDKSRLGRQQRQTVGASSATLSFDAIFDTTRPKDLDQLEAEDRNDEAGLDVRKRTKPIADLLAALPKAAGSGKGPNKAPFRVQFQWGTILFSGVITAHQETFDFFAPTGVPLRSKVQLTLTEQNFIYAVTGNDVAQQAAAVTPSTMRSAAAASGADSLFSPGPDGRPLGFSADLSPDISRSAEISLSAQLGVSAEFGVSLDAGFSLDASAAIDVFGSAALSINGPGASGAAGGGAGGGGDFGQAGLSRPPPTPAAPGGDKPPPSPWAPDGPAPGSSAAGIAAVVNGMRAGGAAVPPPGGPGAPTATTPAPIRGSPPPLLPRTPLSAGTVYDSTRLVPQQVLDGDRLPRWQVLSAATVTQAAASAAAHHGGCGCRSCRGG